MLETLTKFHSPTYSQSPIARKGEVGEAKGEAGTQGGGGCGGEIKINLDFFFEGGVCAGGVFCFYVFTFIFISALGGIA